MELQFYSDRHLVSAYSRILTGGGGTNRRMDRRCPLAQKCADQCRTCQYATLVYQSMLREEDGQ